MHFLNKKPVIFNTFAGVCTNGKIYRRSSVKKNVASTVPCKITIYRTVQKFLITGLVLNVQKVRKSVLAEDKLHDIGAQMETNPRKPLCQLAVYSAVSHSSAHRQRNF